jgi:hypothetical protein
MSGKLKESTKKPSVAYGGVPYTYPLKKGISPSEPTKSYTLTKIVGGLAAAFAFYVGGSILYEVAREHDIVSSPDVAKARGQRVNFSPADDEYYVSAKETCLHTKPDKSEFIDICYKQDEEIRGKVLAPPNKEAPSWLVVQTHYKENGNYLGLSYVPLKDLKPAPIAPQAKIKPEAKKLHHKPTP